MQMRPGRAAGIARLPQDLSFAHDVACANEFLRQMSVPRLAAAFVIDHHRVAVTVLDAGKRNHAIGRSLDVWPYATAMSTP